MFLDDRGVFKFLRIVYRNTSHYRNSQYAEKQEKLREAFTTHV